MSTLACDEYLRERFSGEYVTERVNHEFGMDDFITEVYLRRNMLPREPKRTSAIDEEREQQHNGGGEREDTLQETAEEQEKKNPTITNPHWENSNGESITKALVGDEVYLCADVQDIDEGASAFIKLVIEEPNNTEKQMDTIQCKIKNGKIQKSWILKYIKDFSFENRNYKLPNYKFYIDIKNQSNSISSPLSICTHNNDDIYKIVNYIINEIRLNTKSETCKTIIESIKIFKNENKIANLLNFVPFIGKGLKIEALVLALSLWTMKVRTDGDWDHKPLILKKFPHQGIERPIGKKKVYSNSYYYKYKDNDYFYDIWSNIHYGYVGTFCGFPEGILLDGAGIEQLGTSIKLKIKQDYKNIPVSGDSELPRKWDDKGDRESIALGINLFKEHPNPKDLNALEILEKLEKISDLGDSRLKHICFCEGI